MLEWLVNLTEAQAILASAIITMLGAIGALLLGRGFFSGKVSDIQTALEKTEQLVAAHQERVTYSLSDIEEKISSLTSATGQIRADVSDSRAQEGKEQTREERATGTNAEPAFEDLQSSWLKIRDHLEEIAADSKIDGRTAAKYARIDRRNYADLIASLNRDGLLGDSGNDYIEAAQLWASHRTRKKTPSVESIGRMQALSALLAAAA